MQNISRRISHFTCIFCLSSAGEVMLWFWWLIKAHCIHISCWSWQQYSSSSLWCWSRSGSVDVVTHWPVCAILMQEMYNEFECEIHSKKPNTPDRTWWLLVWSLCRCHTPRLQHGKTQDRRGCSCFWCFSLHSLYNFSQHSVSAERWFWAERLPALGAAVNTLLIIPIPEFIKTGHTETVTTSCSYWIAQRIKTDRTVKEILIIRSHFAALKTVGKQ